MQDKIYKITLITIVSIVLIFAAFSLFKGEEEVVEDKKSYNNVLLYTKKGCMYCSMAEELLDKYSIRYTSIDITDNSDLQLKLFNQTGQNTVPYIFIQKNFIGGYSNLMEMANKGELSDIAAEFVALDKNQ